MTWPALGPTMPKRGTLTAAALRSLMMWSPATRAPIAALSSSTSRHSAGASPRSTVMPPGGSIRIQSDVSSERESTPATPSSGSSSFTPITITPVNSTPTVSAAATVPTTMATTATSDPRMTV